MTKSTFVCRDCGEAKPLSQERASHKGRCLTCVARAMREQHQAKAEAHRLKWLAIANGEIPFPPRNEN